MCIVCTEWQAGKLTNKEALHNLGELIGTETGAKSSHYYKVVDEVMEDEMGGTPVDQELDIAWHRETHGE